MAVDETMWETVAAAQAGDRAAWETFYLAHNAFLCRYIRGRGIPPVDADDLASTVWVRAVAALPRLTRSPSGPKAWLTTIARNVVVDHVKSGWVTRVRAAGLFGDHSDASHPTITADMLPAAPDNPERDAIRRVESGHIRAAVAELTPRQSQVVAGRYLRDLSIAQAATYLGVSQTAIRDAQCVALQRLRRGALADLLGVA